MSLSIKSNGSFAFMGIAAAVTREAALRVAINDELQMLYAALYAGRFASVAMSTRALLRTDCLDTSTVQVYTTPRAYRKAALISTHFC
jgi:hypothetical protein